MTMPTGHKPRRAGGPVKVGDVIQCQCGTCGLSFVMEDIRFANRRYHPECPVRVRKAQKPYEVNLAQEERRKARIADERPVKICETCCNLPHRRPAKGCPECKLPQGEAPAARMSLLSSSPIISRCAILGWLVMGCSGPVPLPEAAQCDLKLAPDGVHDAMIQSAADRLFAATGADYGVAECGWPVFFIETVINPEDGAEVCGYTSTFYDRGERVTGEIYVALSPPPGCISPESTIVHEAIHATRPWAEHAKHGLFAKGADSEYLNGESLTILCDALGYCPIREDERP